MQPCQDEAHDHDHHDHHHHDHDHTDEASAGDEYSLYNVIDMDHVVILNQRTDAADYPLAIQPQHIIRPWHERWNLDRVLESDCDAQMIITIPFSASVKLKSIIVFSTHGTHSPSTMKAFINRDDVDFDSVESIQPDQEWELAVIPTEQSAISTMPEYPTKISKFTNVRNLILYFPCNFTSDEDEPTKISFIGLKGEWTAFTRDPIITIYEAAANPADHKAKQDTIQSNTIM